MYLKAKVSGHFLTFLNLKNETNNSPDFFAKNKKDKEIFVTGKSLNKCRFDREKNGDRFEVSKC